MNMREKIRWGSNKKEVYGKVDKILPKMVYVRIPIDAQQGDMDSLIEEW